jgi:hypothetical protein
MWAHKFHDSIDHVGEITCIVHQEIMDQYKLNLHPGCVLVLKQVKMIL